MRKLKPHFTEAYIIKCRANGGVIHVPVHHGSNAAEEDDTVSMTTIAMLVRNMQIANNASCQHTKKHIATSYNTVNSLLSMVTQYATHQTISTIPHALSP